MDKIHPKYSNAENGSSIHTELIPELLSPEANPGDGISSQIWCAGLKSPMSQWEASCAWVWRALRAVWDPLSAPGKLRAKQLTAKARNSLAKSSIYCFTVCSRETSPLPEFGHLRFCSDCTEWQHCLCQHSVKNPQENLESCSRNKELPPILAFKKIPEKTQQSQDALGFSFYGFQILSCFNV